MVPIGINLADHMVPESTMSRTAIFPGSQSPSRSGGGRVRQRGSDGNIGERLARKVDGVAPDVSIVNISSAGYHARQLLCIIRNTK
jgi:hypothetical protein